MTQDPVLDIPEEIEVITVRVPEREALHVEANGSSITIFGDGRVSVVSDQPVHIRTPTHIEISATNISIDAGGEKQSS
ncbi:hypothetical protein F8V45_24740 [Salmonella enterica]|nr:hypothetical protein [Salmonella enterica]